jgi:transposase InsO family protein
VVRGLHCLGYSERKSCALVGFARSTYYGIKFHRPSDRDMHQLLLEDAIKEIHVRILGTYGRLRIKAALEMMQIELLNRQKWRTIIELTAAIADWLENFYNTESRHSALNYFTPNEFEGLHSTQPTQDSLS